MLLKLSKLIDLNKTRGVFINKKCLPGITRFIKSRFFPNYRYTKNTSKKSNGGRKFGTKVDRELTNFCKTKKLTPNIQNIVDRLNKLNLEIKYSQFPVFNLDWNLGTHCDLICWDKIVKRWVIVEIKTGYKGYKYTSCGQMKEPLDYLNNSPLNQHLLQAFLSCRLFQHNFPNEKNTTSIVIYDTGEYHFNSIKTNLDDILLYESTNKRKKLCRCSKKKKKKRRIKKK